MPELLPYEDGNGKAYLWHYVPSQVAGGVVAGCYALMTLFILFRMVRSRTWFSTPFIIGGILEAVGYLARVWAAPNTDKLAPYALQTILILISPALMAASVYMILGRVIRSVHAEHHSIIRVSWLTKIFVVTDIMSFIVQTGGATMLQNDDIDPDIGKTVILVGLFIQVVAFCLFIIASILFHLRIRREPTSASTGTKVPWRMIMRMMYCVNGLILARSIFRIVEYMMGTDSYLFQHEWPLYAFDAAPMLMSFGFYAGWYPSRLNPMHAGDDATYTVPLHPAPSHKPSTGYGPIEPEYEPPASYGQPDTGYRPSAPYQQPVSPLSPQLQPHAQHQPMYSHGSAV